jgi:hypothetical protein
VREAEALRPELELALRAQRIAAESDRMALLAELHTAEIQLSVRERDARAAEAEIQSLGAQLLENLNTMAVLESAAAAPPSPGAVLKAQALEAAKSKVNGSVFRSFFLGLLVELALNRVV